MLGRLSLVLLLLWSGAAAAADFVDATGRSVAVPAQVTRVLPAGPPAAVLLEALAPDLMIGWPAPMPDDARAMLSPSAPAQRVPRLTGQDDVTDKVQALKPDLIVDYGVVSPRYANLAAATQTRTGIPTILLNGSLADIPQTFRLLGSILHRTERAETLATLAEAMLSLPVPQGGHIQGGHVRVVYARGEDGLTVAAPGTDVTEIFTRLGWQALAPDGQGTFRHATIDDIAHLDPDIVIFSDPRMRDTVLHPTAWQSVRAMREGHAYVAPSLPFGWVEEPPSVNRLLGLAWLEGRDPVILAALFGAITYGHVPTTAERDAVLSGLPTMHP